MVKAIFILGIFMLPLTNSAQLKFNYHNPDINVPDFLTNPNHIDENTDEETEINIAEGTVCEIGDYTIVRIKYSTAIHNSGDDELYLASFNKKQKLVDITFVHEYSDWDWNWTTEISFECEEQNRVLFFHVMEWYRPAESEEEAQEFGGMILDRADTTNLCYKIARDGKIHDCEAFEDVDEISEEFDEAVAIEQIREWFAQINKNAKAYLTKTKKVSANIILISYYEEDELKKIVAANSATNTTEEYYFNDGELVFVFSYNRTTKTGNRYYFYDSKMFKWLKGNEKLDIGSDSKEFYDTEHELFSKRDKYSKQ